MTTFVDASVIVAILGEEADSFDQAARLQDVDHPICSAVSIWEATVALTRKLDQPVAIISRLITDLIAFAAIEIVDIGEREASLALSAYEMYGKGRHKARLNMGDCFAYACAKAHSASLLYKGRDFAETDLA